MATLISKIEDCLRNRLREAGVQFPTVIVMHPKTWEVLIGKLVDNDIPINKYIFDLRYNGIPVFRSYDIKEEEFIVK